MQTMTLIKSKKSPWSEKTSISSACSERLLVRRRVQANELKQSNELQGFTNKGQISDGILPTRPPGKIVDTENKSVFVLENLGTKRMTASAAGTVDEPGKNVAQKSGLNKEILNIGWNQIAIFLTYKAMRAGKVVFKVSPNHTSQECSHCGYTHQDNRPEQELFVCGKCGHTENADKNASRVIGKRAIKLILDSGTELSSKGVLTPKKIKTGRRKAKFSAEAGTTQ
jgi:ribosomal protein L37AE/L43A